MKSSATKVTSVKFVQGGFQNNPQIGTVATVRICVITVGTTGSVSQRKNVSVACHW
jgi:hypothetical protein